MGGGSCPCALSRNLLEESAPGCTPAKPLHAQFLSTSETFRLWVSLQTILLSWRRLLCLSNRAKIIFFKGLINIPPQETSLSG